MPILESRIICLNYFTGSASEVTLSLQFFRTERAAYDKTMQRAESVWPETCSLASLCYICGLADLVYQGPRAYFSKVSKLFGVVRVPQFPLQLRNAEVLSHQTSQSSWFSYIKSMLNWGELLKRSGWLFGPEKFSGLSRNKPQFWQMVSAVKLKFSIK